MREPRTTWAVASIARRMPSIWVTSWFGEVKTATSGACSPDPKSFRVRWFASYAE